MTALIITAAFVPAFVLAAIILEPHTHGVMDDPKTPRTGTQRFNLTKRSG